MSEPDIEHFVANNPDSIIIRQMERDKREIERLEAENAELREFYDKWREMWQAKVSECDELRKALAEVDDEEGET